jgi:hypothetical protein
MKAQDISDLKKAKQLLEKGSLAVTMSNWFGDITEKLIIKRLPVKWREALMDATILAIEKSWEFTVGMMPDMEKASIPDKNYKNYALLSGAIGGVTIPTLFAELPVTTVIMLRSVADIAKDEGEDFNDFDTKIACLEVFALGSKETDTKEKTSYYATRKILEQPLIESSKYIAKKGATGIGVPFLAQIFAKIAVRYQAALSTRIAASVVPVTGAICGAAINIIFINYFQDKARGHFIMRRLEKQYGQERVKQAYIQDIT